ncbi:MAG TPA: carbohydrate-binding family 9-like protein [Capsulimonadaceae bacterium]|jgi:hypothetical protein
MKIVVLIFLLLFDGVTSHAQQSVSRFPVLEAPYATIAPKLDASGNDPAWKAAATIPALGLAIGSDSRDVALPTTVQVLWDARYLYIRFRCAAQSVYTPYGGSVRDQPIYRGDAVEVFLDVRGDAKQVTEIQVSPNNELFDQQLLITTDVRCDQDGKLREDVLSRDFWAVPSWDCAGLTTKTHREGDVWIADLAIPAAPILRRLGATQWEPLTFRANLMRYTWTPDTKAGNDNGRRLIAQNWSLVRHGCPHISPQAMGYIHLLPAPK